MAPEDNAFTKREGGQRNARQVDKEGDAAGGGGKRGEPGTGMGNGDGNGKHKQSRGLADHFESAGAEMGGGTGSCRENSQGDMGRSAKLPDSQIQPGRTTAGCQWDAGTGKAETERWDDELSCRTGERQVA